MKPVALNEWVGVVKKDKSLTGYWCTSSGLFHIELFQLPLLFSAHSFILMITSVVEDKHISKSSPVWETEGLICFQNYSDHLLSKSGPLWVDPKVLDPVPNLVYGPVAVCLFPELCADVWTQSAALTTATVSYSET